MKINYWQTFNEKAYYHIYNRSVGQTSLFLSHGNYQFFMQKWQLYLSNYLDTYAYCLMSNHFHFVVKVKTVDENFKNFVKIEHTVASQAFLDEKITLDVFLEDQFKRFLSSYAKSFNKQHNRHGSLIEKRFKRIELKRSEQVLEKIAYVHHNPLHHSLSPRYEDWHFSSYATYVSIKPTKLKRSEGFGLFGGKESFVDYHNEFHIHWIKYRGKRSFGDEMDL